MNLHKRVLMDQRAEMTSHLVLKQSFGLKSCLLWVVNGAIKLPFRGKLYSKFSFGDVYRQIYGRKFSFTVAHERSHKT